VAVRLVGALGRGPTRRKTINTGDRKRRRCEMKKIKNYMVVHRDPQVPWEKVEENWSRMVDLEPATWIRTFYNMDEKVRYCLWQAPNEDILKKIFSEFSITWESILEVKETVPDIWEKKYREQMEAEDREDTAADFF
jgi:hypothetical protein